jgi:gliding motility-associated lipoprotein GldH
MEGLEKNQAMQNKFLYIPSYRGVPKGRGVLIAILCVALIGAFFSCNNNTVLDSNVSIPENNWTYAKTAKSVIEIKDTLKTYNIYFKLRHTADYRFANLYVLFHLKGQGVQKNMRYQFKLAQSDGQWLGKGSGDLFTYQFPLIRQFRFPKVGKYELEIEQNMRNNPLAGISDIGIRVVPNN